MKLTRIETFPLAERWNEVRLAVSPLMILMLSRKHNIILNQ